MGTLRQNPEPHKLQTNYFLENLKRKTFSRGFKSCLSTRRIQQLYCQPAALKRSNNLLHFALIHSHIHTFSEIGTKAPQPPRKISDEEEELEAIKRRIIEVVAEGRTFF